MTMPPDEKKWTTSSIRVAGRGKNSVFKLCIVEGERIVAAPFVVGEQGTADMQRAADCYNACRDLPDPEAAILQMKALTKPIAELTAYMPPFCTKCTITTPCLMVAAGTDRDKDVLAVKKHWYKGEEVDVLVNQLRADLKTLAAEVEASRAWVEALPDEDLGVSKELTKEHIKAREATDTSNALSRAREGK